jgi:hypothetical protein
MFGRNSPRGILPGLLDARATSQKTSVPNYSLVMQYQVIFEMVIWTAFFIYQLMHKTAALKNIKIYIKTAPTCFGLITIIREHII